MKNKVIAALCFAFLLFSCKKEPEDSVPVVETYDVSNIGESSALCGGKIVSEGTSKVIARGVCWSKKNPPTVNDPKSFNNDSNVGYVSVLDHLEYATTYYVMAYALNNTGYGYGEVKSFSTPGGLPIVETREATNIGLNSARLNCMVIANHYYANMFFEWGRTTAYGNDTAFRDNAYRLNPTNEGAYINNLTKGTLYHYRIKAVNPLGTTYGNDMTFMTNESPASPGIFNPDLTYGSVSDIDGNTYKTIQIGTQTWMAENLKTTKFNNGTKISDFEAYSTLPQYGWYNYDAGGNKDVFGALYNWYAVDPAIRTLKNICPVGWHVPGDTEWNLLTDYLGGNNSAGSKLKETTTTHWLSPNAGATNESGFTALPGGYNKDGEEDFLYFGSMSFWWSTTINTANTLPYYWSVSKDSGETSKSEINKRSGLSVRCLKD